MRTLQTKLIDGYQIIIGINHNRPIDPIATQKKNKTKEKRRNNPVYFDLRNGEVEKTDEEITELQIKFLAKEKTEQILLDGKVIPDFKGRKYFFKNTENEWETGFIKEIGHNLTFEILIEDLTTEQSAEIQTQTESERIKGMTTEEKENEFDLNVDALLSQAVLMKNKLEIQADSLALDKSQEFYQSKLAELEIKYK